uniref:dihydroorotase n=1 Tax=Pararhizobium sp. IMCC3301 TaxID=3067904 RepID=UPI0027419500|nr:dihydroorotase [Pararhizobium sp. IMCC3301]
MAISGNSVHIRNGRLVCARQKLDEISDLLIIDGRIAAMGPAGKLAVSNENIPPFDAAGKLVLPGFVDMQVNVGEPGEEHKETLATASAAAAAGGITTIVTTPDTDPVIDDPALVDFMLRRARDTASVKVHPAAALTKAQAGQEMTEFGLLKEAGAVAFSSGRRALQNALILRRALTYARDFDCLIIHHAEDPDLAAGGVMNEGENATRLGLPGIPHEAELIMIDRDIRLAALTGSRCHIAQLSTAAGVAAIRTAKAAGIPVTAGVSVNHLSLNEIDIGAYRTFFKLSPPLRLEDDRQALIDGVADGTIDVIVSNHDPQNVEAKRHPFAEAESGAIGLETLFSATMRLVHDERLSLIDLVRAASDTPARLLGLAAGSLEVGSAGDIAIADPDAPWIASEDQFRSRSKNTAFEDARFSGRIVRTFVDGKCVFNLDT